MNLIPLTSGPSVRSVRDAQHGGPLRSIMPSDMQNDSMKHPHVSPVPSLARAAQRNLVIEKARDAVPVSPQFPYKVKGV